MTNKIVLKEVDQFLSDYTPAYTPFMPSFLAGRSTAYSQEVGKLNFKRLEALGDIRSRLISPKDTEIKQILAGETKKSFNKYFLGSQFRISDLQDSAQVEDVRAQALDEHNKQNDELFFTGGGVSDATVINNGLYYSNDSNFVKKTSYEVQKDTDSDHLADLHTKLMEVYQEADEVDGRKMIVFFGANTIKKFNGLFVQTKAPFLKTLKDGIESEVAVAKLPVATTPAGADGFMVVNLDKVKVHYTALPTIKNQGVNDENGYAWTNFVMGSSMVEVTALGGIIRQPLTYEA